jgi:hypothetical protein
MYTGIGISNICTKQDILNGFNLFLWDRYDWLGHDQIDKIMAKADQILEDDSNYDYLGHRNLYNQIIGV